ncbi:MAG: fucose isomerase [Caldilineaceae bacterium]|nr:fucose isomerase [Caldilineaceae bacterium]
MSAEALTVALVAIARPTFDVPLAQSMASDAAAQLHGAGFTVTGSGDTLIMDGSATEQTRRLLAGATFDVLVLLQASFADSSVAVELAQLAHERRVPVLLWAVPDARAGGRLRLNSLCGINLAAHALMLRHIVYDHHLGLPGDPSIVEKIAQLARVGGALRRLQGAIIGLVGDHPAGFDTCAYDAADLAHLFGVEVRSLPLTAVLAQAASTAEAERDAFVERVAAFTPNLDALDRSGVRGTAGVYSALRRTVNDLQLAGLSVRCWPEFFTELGCAACGAMSVLNEERCPASCEADVNGTVTSLLLQALSGEPPLIADLVSIEPESDSGVLWHCGLAPASMADPQAEVLGTVHSNRGLPLLFEFPLKPGRVTVARLHRTVAGAGTRGYQLAIGGGTMLQAPKSFTGTSGVIRFDRPALDVFDTVMRAGLEHHISFVYGDVRHELRWLARMVGLTVLDLT